MSIFRKREADVTPTPEEPRFGYTREQLSEVMGGLGTGSALQEEFTDGELWPTAGLPDRAIELLGPKLRKAERAIRRERKA